MIIIHFIFYRRTFYLSALYLNINRLGNTSSQHSHRNIRPFLALNFAHNIGTVLTVHTFAIYLINVIVLHQLAFLGRRILNHAADFHVARLHILTDVCANPVINSLRLLL